MVIKYSEAVTAGCSNEKKTAYRDQKKKKKTKTQSK